MLEVCERMKSLLEIQGLRKSFPIKSGIFRKTVGHVDAVDGVDITVFPNETLGLVGESGCGKTTLAKLILCLEEPDAGRIIFDGADIHKATAAEVFDTALESVTADQRRQAKAINFGLIYGMSAFGLANQLDIDRYLAQQYIDQYFDRYPGVSEYMERTRQSAEIQGYVETLFGRRLYLPDIRSPNRMRKQAAERAAINAPMQGTAADIIKNAMIMVDRWLIDECADARLIMQVHDELVLEVPENRLELVCGQVQALMEGAAQLQIPLVADVGWGRNWDEAH